MPSINNYTFSEPVFNIPEESNIVTLVGATAVITITPNAGFTATAGDFSTTSFNATYISNVAFTQSGNNVLCTMTLINTATMPSSNLTLGLCVSGSAIEKLITIGGKYSAVVGSNVTGDSSETNVTYSASGITSTVSSLFTKTYNAATGYFWGGVSIPSINIVKGNQKHYSIAQTPTFDASNRLTNIAYAVSYQFPNKDVSGDEILINVPSTQEIYVPVNKITSYIFDTSTLSNNGDLRKLTVLGVPGTTFGATLNDGTATTVIINNQSLDANGRFEQDVLFPVLIKGDPPVNYTITLTGANISGSMNLPNPFTIKQMNEVLIQIDHVPNVPTPITGWPVVNPRVTLPAVINSPFPPSANVEQYEGLWLITLNYDIQPSSGTGTFAIIKKEIVNEDFSNTQPLGITATAATSSSTSLDVSSTTGITAGDGIVIQALSQQSFNGLSVQEGFAPFRTTVTSVNSATNLTISQARSAVNGQDIRVFTDHGNKIEVYDGLATLKTGTVISTVNIYAKIAITRTGDSDITFDLDLSNLISYTP